MADTHGSWAAIQRDLNRLEKKAREEPMKFNKREREVLHQGRITTHQHALATDQLKNSFAVKDLGVPTDKIYMTQQYAAAAWIRLAQSRGKT